MLFVKPLAFAVTLSTMSFMGMAFASDDSPGHFKPESSDTLEQAVDNFSRYNTKLSEVLAGELDAKAIYDIHQMTYTLEVALEKINNELEELAEVLEELHKATERNDAATALIKGREYLDTSRKVIR